MTRGTIAVAVGAAALVFGCGSTTSGLSDGGGPDQARCVGSCGGVTGIMPDVPGGCTFTPLCSQPNAYTGIFVFVNGQMVTEDPTMTDGWNFTDVLSSAFQLYGQACADAQAGGSVDFGYTCEVALTAP